ncbi:EAL domain-containing protein [Noviherbaspirillum saxi]|uniref:EAL domain-containing protein n=2 Tax=Noviherbaspirillum saxi TaxID=2320863 RepID=A0A3A3FI60_9BURK|nr:EAL domain-containing protein [Noviherbaspirillum saxi]
MSQPPRVRKPSPAALVTLLLGLVLTTLLFGLTYELETDKASLDFRRRAENYINDLQRGVEDAVASLQAVNQLFASVGEVDQEEFETFTEPLLARQPYIRAFTYHRFISSRERRMFEASMRRIHPGFQIRESEKTEAVPAGNREQYLPAIFIAPKADNQSRIGSDALSNPQRAAAAWRAIDRGAPSATGIVQTILSATNMPTFFVVMPLYRSDMPLTTMDERRKAVFGVTQAVFNAHDLVARGLGHQALSTSGLEVSVHAAAAGEAQQLAFHHKTGQTNVDGRWLSDSALFGEQTLTVSESFDVGGTIWTILVSGGAAPFTYSHRASLLVLIFGLLLSVASALNRQSAASRAQHIEKLVEQRTVELSRTSRDLELRKRAIEASANAIMITSAQGPDFAIEYVNPAFTRITGYQANEVMGKSFDFLCGTDRDQAGALELRAALSPGTESNAIVRHYRKDGTQFWNHVYVAPVTLAGRAVTHFVVTQYDITETRRYQAELEFQANYDLLTGIANRNLLRDRVTQALTMAARHEERVFIAFMDIDRFKFINDSLGHRAGDLFLKTIAQRLKRAARDTDTVARYGGDEFVLVLPEADDIAESARVVQRVMQALSRPVPINGKDFFPTCSAGIAVYPTDGHDFETLITHADIAMYSAKEKGRNNFQFYAPTMNERAAKRLQLEGDLRRALERRELVLHYQPQIDVSTSRIVGAEALIRWQHPELGLISPAEFISLAEETGLIGAIGDWVLRTSCAQARHWELAGLGKLRIAINLSARQFNQPNLVRMVQSALADSGLQASDLELEITESTVMVDVQHAIRTLHELKSIDVNLSIDDFGTGFSSLSYLKQFPIDVLKIDQSFVHDLATDPDNAMIVMSVISLAHNLRLQVIAEGVETAEQLSYLREHKCDQVQGYLFSKPLPADKFERFLKQELGTEA